MDPEAGIEEDYKLKNDKAYCWKVTLTLTLTLTQTLTLTLTLTPGRRCASWPRRTSRSSPRLGSG